MRALSSSRERKRYCYNDTKSTMGFADRPWSAEKKFNAEARAASLSLSLSLSLTRSPKCVYCYTGASLSLAPSIACKRTTKDLSCAISRARARGWVTLSGRERITPCLNIMIERQQSALARARGRVSKQNTSAMREQAILVSVGISRSLISNRDPADARILSWNFCNRTDTTSP
jgi:hypothetical protein